MNMAVPLLSSMPAPIAHPTPVRFMGLYCRVATTMAPVTKKDTKRETAASQKIEPSPACLMHRKYAAKPRPASSAEANPLGRSRGIFDARDKPEPMPARKKPKGYRTRHAFGDGGKHGGDGRAQNGSHGRGEAHISLRQRAVKNCQREAAEEARNRCP